ALYSAFENGFFGILVFKSRQAKIGWKSLSQNQLPSSNQELTGQQCCTSYAGKIRRHVEVASGRIAGRQSN
ncbi:MAG: hypothetical protein DMG30_23565, partial [Acidobacteria bacterium]